MLELHGRGRLVDLLAAGPAALEEVFFEVGVGDDEAGWELRGEGVGWRGCGGEGAEAEAEGGGGGSGAVGEREEARGEAWEGHRAWDHSRE